MPQAGLRRPEGRDFSLSKFPTNLRLTKALQNGSRVAPEEPVISIDRVQELRSEVGDDDFEEIVALFIAESDAILDQLRAVGSSAEAEALLHALKGSALNLGFDELARLCREGRGAAAGSADWPGRFAELRDIYEQSKVRFSEMT
jgi:hypothetical protein